MIVLCAGHHPGARGACYHDVCEWEEAMRWADITANLLRGRLPVRGMGGTLAEKVAGINELPGVTLACEIHFNSDTSKKQQGSETLYAPGSKLGQVAAGIVQSELAGVFPPSRGVKAGWYRQDHPGRLDYQGDIEGDEAPLYFLARTRCVALIVEPEFIYNYDRIEERRHAGCNALANGLHKAALMLANKAD